MIKKVIIVILALIVGLQFFRGEEPEVIAQNENDLLQSAVISADVSQLLRSACYDCHSFETRYPWYSYITPVSWFLFDHVNHGREELNFSEWSSLKKRTKIRKLKDIAEEVGESKMPLDSYTIMHGDAKLTADQRQLIVDWADTFAAEVMSN